jgi:hypothetical protein
MVSWFSKKQATIALGSTKGEYMAASSVSCEAIWLRKLVAESIDETLEPIVIYCDNQSCITLSKNRVFHD